MRRTSAFAIALLVLPAVLGAQQPAAAEANPVTAAARRMNSYLSGNLMKAAEQVPADKLSYKPTDAQMTFGQIWNHLASANYAFCGGIGGMTAPKVPEYTGSETKDALVDGLKASFKFCDDALAKTDDSNLGEEVSLEFMKGTRALGMFIYIEDLADHYSQVANYMRLNGMLPPSAQPRGK